MRYAFALVGLAALAAAAPVKMSMGTVMEADAMKIDMTQGHAEAMETDAINMDLNAAQDRADATEADAMNMNIAPEHDKREPTGPFIYGKYGPYGTYGPYGLAVDAAAAKAEGEKRALIHLKPLHPLRPMNDARMPERGPVMKTTEHEDTAQTMEHGIKRSTTAPDASEIAGAKEKGKKLPYNWYGKYDPYANYGSYKSAGAKQAAETEGAKAEGAGTTDA